MEETNPPDAGALQSALGDKYPRYLGVLEAAVDLEQEWKHYGKKYGWKLKAHDGNKALFELTVVEGGFRIGMAVRERELQALRASPVAVAALGELLDAERSKEGWGIRLEIGDDGSYERALFLIKAVAGLRQDA
jgi:hypothetical protein